MNKPYTIPHLPLRYELETKVVLKQANKANKKLAELKGIATAMPNEGILISTLTLQEAQESSEIENIVTTQDDLYKADLQFSKKHISGPTKEVLNYREAILHGFEAVKRNKVLTTKVIIEIQEVLVGNKAGFRTLPGTKLKDSRNQTIYTPPQSGTDVKQYMFNIEEFINNNELCDCDPLIKMAIIHHQFESIHPFYDGNGRTGRIINILYLVVNELLDLPILYLSRYITRNKARYYQLIQAIRDKDGDNSKEWEEWILFILQGVEQTAEETIELVKNISVLMANYKSILRPMFGKQYKHDLLNNLFFHPYTKIGFMEKELMVQRKTATKYLNKMADAGLLVKVKMGRENYYINKGLVELFMSKPKTKEKCEAVESITE